MFLYLSVLHGKDIFYSSFSFKLIAGRKKILSEACRSFRAVYSSDRVRPNLARLHFIHSSSSFLSFSSSVLSFFEPEKSYSSLRTCLVTHYVTHLVLKSSTSRDLLSSYSVFFCLSSASLSSSSSSSSKESEQQSTRQGLGDRSARLGLPLLFDHVGADAGSHSSQVGAVDMRGPAYPCTVRYSLYSL